MRQPLWRERKQPLHDQIDVRPLRRHATVAIRMRSISPSLRKPPIRPAPLHGLKAPRRSMPRPLRPQACLPPPACFTAFTLQELPLAINFALSAARAHARSTSRDNRTALRKAAESWRATHREQRENELQEMGVVIPLSEWLGHNNGPDILESLLFKQWRWSRLRTAAFAPPDAETGIRWARKAAELGLSYEEYRLELLERGRYPTDEDARRIRAARPR